jgi:hypothetical protein
MEEWWEAPIEVLQDNLRNNVKQEDKKTYPFGYGRGCY